MDFISILHLLKDIVKDLYSLGLHLGIARSALDAIEDNFPADVERRRRELVRVWLSSTHCLEPTCWWKLVQALRQTDENVLAEKIQKEHGE